MIGDDSWVPPIDRNSGALIMPLGQVIGVPSAESGQEFTNTIARLVWAEWEAHLKGDA